MAVETLAERYDLEQLIGSGGMADVYCGFDRRLERRVAVKILHPAYEADPEVLERFRREARSVAKLNHPNLVTVIDRGEVDGRQFIVLEYVEGHSLKYLLREGPRLPIDRALGLALDAGRGLAFAHQQGVIHRDVKPENILVGPSGAKVTDFGIAYAAGLEELTLTGTVLGTSYYVSPEQAAGKTSDARSDVYSLGVVLFELLTGDVPFHGTSFVEVAMKHVATPAPLVGERNPDVPPRLAAAVDRALEKDPDRRFATMDAFVAELEACQAGLEPAEADRDTLGGAATVVRAAAAVVPRRRRRREPAAVPVPAPAVAATARSRRGRRSLVPLALVVLIAVGVGAFLLDRSPSSHGPGTPTAAAGPITVSAVGIYNPGLGGQNNGEVPRATDGNAHTAWSTQGYQTRQFGGLTSGVGIVVAAPAPVELGELRVQTDTPGFTAEIKAGASKTGPFTLVSSSTLVGADTVFRLSVRSPARYYLVWITDLAPTKGPYGYEADVNEVTAP